MTEKTLKMLKEVVDIRKHEARKQKEQCCKEIKKAIENIISMDNVKVTRVDDSYDWTTEVEVVDEEGKGVFGANFTIYYRTDDDKKYIEVNHGTCGSFGKEDKPYIDRIVALLKVLQALDEVKKVYETLPTDKIDAFNEAYWEVYRAENELRANYRKEIETTLAVGNEYDDGATKVTKITPKYVTYEYIKGVWAGKEEKERKEDFVEYQAKRRMKLLDEQ